MGNLMEGAGSAATGGIIGGGLGLLSDKIARNQQLKQEQKLQELHIQGGKQMAEFNQGLAIDTWQKTGPEAQRKQLEKAGLNVGLMYQHGGPGGTTSQAGQISGSQGAGDNTNTITAAGMGLERAMQAQRQKAEIQNINADTELKKASKPKTEKETEGIQANIENVKQQTQNLGLQAEGIKWENDLKRIETQIKLKTTPDIIKEIRLANEKLEQEINLAKTQNKVDTAKADDLIKQAKQATVEQFLRIKLQKVGIDQAKLNLAKTGAEIDKIAQEIAASKKSLDQKDIELTLKALQQEFDQSDPYQLRAMENFLDHLEEELNELLKGAN